MEMTILKFPLFGKEIEIMLHEVDPLMLEQYKDVIIAESLRLQKIFNMFDPKSEVSKLNKERKIIASGELLEVMKRALYYCQKTGGLYDISKGKEFLAQKKGIKGKKAGCSFKDISIIGKRIALLHEDVIVDLGSIAKGFIGDRIVAFLEESGFESGLVDARGDLKLFGDFEQTIGVMHPRKKEETIISIRIKGSAVATSGDYNQFHGSYKNSHIIGKRNFCSVTVVAESLMEADVVATCVFLLDEKKVEQFLRDKPTVRVYAIDNELKSHFYNGFEELIVK